jgi:hypothetical protein
MLWSILFFAAVTYLLGSSAIQLATGRLRLDLQTHALSTGVGLAGFAVLTVVLNALSIPLAWWSFLAAALVLLLLAVLRCRYAGPSSSHEPREEPLGNEDLVCLLIAVVLAGLCFAAFFTGALASPWLEDDDSWVHASSAKYVALNRTYSVSPEAREGRVACIEPYPPGYASLMGVLHQLNDSVSTTLRLFNALLVSLGILYFYLMMRQWTGKAALSIWMTGAIWVMPCFMSRFIWAQSMSLVLFFPAFYAFERSRERASWAVVAGLVIAGCFLTQPAAPFTFALLAVPYWTVNLVFRFRGGPDRLDGRTLIRQAAACLVGALPAALYYLRGLVKFGREGLLWGVGQADLVRGDILKITSTSRGRIYGLWDIMWPPPAGNKMDQAIGVGIVLFLAACAGLALVIIRCRSALSSRPKGKRLAANRYLVTACAWLALTGLGIEGNALPVSLYPHRLWVLFAVPLAMLAGEFLAFVASGLDWKNLTLSLTLGLALGCAVALAGPAERMFGIPELPLGGVRLAALIAAAVLTVAALSTVFVRLARQRPDWETWARSLSLALLVAGVALTSGLAKLRVQCLKSAEPGADFLLGAPPEIDPTQTNVRQHIGGYLLIRRRFASNTPILGVTCPEDHLIGFDMYSPPFDLDLKRLRKELEERPPGGLNEALVGRIVDLARSKGFDYVLADPHECAVATYEWWCAKEELARRRRASGMSEPRPDARLESRAEPTREEKPALETVNEAVRTYALAGERRRQAFEKLGRLRELMMKSPELELVLDSGPFGVAVFRLKGTTGRAATDTL